MIEHRAGRLTIENLCGVPLVGGRASAGLTTTGATCRYYAAASGARSGFTPVYNHTRNTPTSLPAPRW